jgi:ribonuclease BN (tRNA processing enzyme)
MYPQRARSDIDSDRLTATVWLKDMKIHFLGTNGWYDTATGNTICILVRTEGHEIILDAGNGFHKIESQIAGTKARTGHLFLSHFHLDHLEGLHMLNTLKSFDRLVIAGPAGTKKVINTLVNKPFTAPLEKLPYSVDVVELPEEDHRISFSLESAPLLHADLCLGYRITIGGKVLAYCPDTGYCENAVRLARNADLVITECAFRSKETDPAWPHLNPEEAARIAREAGAKKLALVHFDASRYRTIDDRKNAEKHARMIFPDTVATIDEMVVDV